MRDLNQTERSHVQWMQEKDPGVIKSLRNISQARALGLLDGALVGAVGDEIPTITPYGTIRSVKEKGFGMIAWNPGIKRISSFVQDIIVGQVLIADHGSEIEELSFPEAINEGLLREVDLGEAFRYYGFRGDMADIQKLQEAGYGHDDIYQVTKAGSGVLDLAFREPPRYTIRTGGTRFKY